MSPRLVGRRMLEILPWLGVMVVGLLVSLWASQRSLEQATVVAVRLDVSRFWIGATLLAVGTDLPEIANSVVSSVTGHGDLNLGDSVGSAVTQSTLVLGLMPILAGPMVVGRRHAAAVGGLILSALGLGAFLVADGFVSRFDAVVLILAWLLASWLVRGAAPERLEVPGIEAGRGGVLRCVVGALFFLSIVGLGTTAAVVSFVRLSQFLDVPEYIISFFMTSVGTSLPELIVDVGALRRGQTDLAAGGILGSSLADSTLSIAAGPLLAPVAVTAALVLRGYAVAVVALAAVVLLLVGVRRHTRWTGLVLIGVYALVYVLLLAGG